MKKYFSVTFVAKPDIIENYGGLLQPYAREVLHSIFGLSKDELKEKLSKIPEVEAVMFLKNGKRVKVYVDWYTHRRWIALSRRYKKQTQYLINQMLFEKLNDNDGGLINEY